MKTKTRIFNTNVKSVKTCAKNVLTNTELWESPGEKPVISLIRKRKWRWIGHSVRKGIDGRLGSRLQGYHPVTPRPIAAGHLCTAF
jgi:hypothetical protein